MKSEEKSQEITAGRATGMFRGTYSNGMGGLRIVRFTPTDDGKIPFEVEQEVIAMFKADAARVGGRVVTVRVSLSGRQIYP